MSHMKENYAYATIGYIKSRNTLSSFETLNIYSSHIGGVPVFYQNIEKSSNFLSFHSSLQCQSCHDNTMMFLTQLYSPINLAGDTIHRSLYVFVCQKRQCSLKSIGWIVLRDQQVNCSLEVEDVIDLKKQNISPLKTSVWDIFEDDDSEEDLSAIHELLVARDESLNKSSIAIPNSIPISNNNRQNNSIDEHYYPCYSLDVYEDCYKKFDIHDDFDEDIGEGTDDNEHIQKLLKSYLAEEEDPLIVEVIKNQGNSSISNSSATARNDSVYDQEDDEVDTNKLLRTDKSRESIEAYFRWIIRRDPSQVLRYSYEGDPIWCTLPFPSDENSICPHCGQSRVFEFQIMPTILSYINMNSSKSGNVSLSDISHQSNSDITRPTEEQCKQFLNILDNDGIDFGVVAIYSCPNSCFPNNNLFYEHAVVQHPSDMSS